MVALKPSQISRQISHDHYHATCWTPNIDNITGSAILSIPCDRESCDHARDQQCVTPGGFHRTRTSLPDLKFIRSNFFCVNTAHLYRIGKSDTLPDVVIRHKYVWKRLMNWVLGLLILIPLSSNALLQVSKYSVMSVSSSTHSIMSSANIIVCPVFI